MPMYVFQCPCCHETREYVFRRVEDRDKAEVCDGCSEYMVRQITSPAQQKPFTPYFHHQLGQNFSSRNEEDRFAKKHGLVNITKDFGKSVMDMANRKGKMK